MIVRMHPKRSSGDGKPRGDLEELPVTARRIEDEVSAARGSTSATAGAFAKNWPTVAPSGFGRSQALTGSRRQVSRPAISASASVTIRSTNSPTVGMS